MADLYVRLFRKLVSIYIYIYARKDSLLLNLASFWTVSRKGHITGWLEYALGFLLTSQCHVPIHGLATARRKAFTLSIECSLSCSHNRSIHRAGTDGDSTLRSIRLAMIELTFLRLWVGYHMY